MTRKIGPLFVSKETCIICKQEFPIKKVRKSRLRVVKRDEDFCTYYHNINPYFYEFLFCNNCKSVFVLSFGKYLKDNDIKTREKIINFYSKMRDIGGLEEERNLEQALRLSKLSILTGNMIGVPYNIIASIFIKIAWLNRLKEDDEEERKYIKLAYENYEKSYQTGEKNLSEEMLVYLLGELSIRLDNYDVSRVWFSKLLSLKNDMALINKGRDRWLSIKENYK